MCMLESPFPCADDAPGTPRLKTTSSSPHVPSPSQTSACSLQHNEYVFVCVQMIAARKINTLPLAARVPVPRRAVAARAASPNADEPVEPEAEPIREFDAGKEVDPTINPATGNPQTGKLIDVYFEVGSILVVVALSFWSMWNVKDVLNQTSQADAMREPAAKTEWLAMDNKNVRLSRAVTSLCMRKNHHASCAWPQLQPCLTLQSTSP
jgi:hypothetical protein